MKMQNKLILSSIMIPILTMINGIKTYAATTIGTQEVETATQNIINAVVELSMPIRNSFYVYKYRNYCYQANCKF